MDTPKPTGSKLLMTSPMPTIKEAYASAEAKLIEIDSVGDSGRRIHMEEATITVLTMKVTRQKITIGGMLYI